MTSSDTERPHSPPWNFSLLEVTLVVMNFALVVVLWHNLTGASEMRSTNIAHYVEADAEANRLLSACFIPQGSYRLQSDDSRPFKLDDESEQK
jgi:hypothetical protein